MLNRFLVNMRAIFTAVHAAGVLQVVCLSLQALVIGRGWGAGDGNAAGMGPSVPLLPRKSATRM